jgi:hypothetical protein
MSEIILDEQGAPAAPAAGQAIIWPDSGASKLGYKDDSGRGFLLGGGVSNCSNAAQGPGFASDTYLTDSDLIIPSFGLQTRTKLFWRIQAAKTAAGTATPIYQVRIGAARTTADTSRLSLTGPAQTAAVDIAMIDILVVLRNAGAAATLRGTVWITHNTSAATGFANVISPVTVGTSAAFDSSAVPGGQFVGLSINGGASAAWTVEQVVAMMDW